MGKHYTCDKCSAELEEHEIRPMTLEDSQHNRSMCRYTHEYDLCDNCSYITEQYIGRKYNAEDKADIKKKEEEEYASDHQYDD